MDVDEVAFSDWQIEQMRSALRRYRTLNKHCGRLPSWERVRDDITASPSNIDRYEDDDADLAFKSEALRRFAESINQTLSIGRLRDVSRFLMDEGLLEREAFQEEKQDLAAFLALHEFFANDYEGAGDIVSAFKGTFTFKFPDEPDAKESRTITLTLIPDKDGGFLRVEETVQAENVAARQRNDALKYRRKAKDSEFIKTTRRKGYGFPITPLKILHIFLDGVVPGGRMTYVQAGELHGDFTENGFFLMRNGVPTGRDRWARDIYYAEPVVLPNVYRFMPVSLKGEVT